MKRPYSLLSLFVATLLITGAPAGAAAPKLLHYQTKVLDANNQPLAGVVVERYRLPGFFARADLQVMLEERATSDSQGKVSFTATNGGMFMLFAHKPGLSVGWSLWLPGFPVGRLGGKSELVLTAPAAVSGVVQDAAGHPVAGAFVWVSAAHPAGTSEDWLPLNSQLGRQFLATRTGTKGEFRIEGLPAGATLDLAAAKPGLAFEQVAAAPFGSGSLQFQAGQSDLVLTLKPGGALAGRVVRADSGGPLAGVRVSVGVNEWNENQGSALTGADGRFVLADLAPGTYEVHTAVGTNAFAEWICEETPTTVEAGKTNQELTLQASRGGVLEVLLRGADHQPATDGVVGVSQELHNQLGVLSEQGVARFRLVPGAYELFAFAEGHQGHQEEVSVAQGETNHVEIALEPAAHLEGIVLGPAGQPAPQVKVTLQPLVSEEKETDAEGRFSLSIQQFGEMPGQPQRCILARDLAHNLAAAADVEADATNLTLRLAPGLTLAGRITDKQGKPITNATAQVMFRTEHMSATLGTPVPADAQGRFELKALPPGRAYGITASATGFGQEQRNIESEDTGTNRLTLEPFQLLRANRRIAGQVVDAEDKPVSGAWVQVAGEHQPSLSGRTDAQGRFRFEHVCAGELQVAANSTRAYGNVEAKAGNTNITVRLGTTHGSGGASGSAKLSGVVRGPDGQPAAKATVSLFPYNGTEQPTDAEGRFKLSFNPEEWGGGQEVTRVLIGRDLAGNLARALEVESEATNADLKLEPALTLAGRVTDAAGKPLSNATARVMLHTARVGSTLGSSVPADAAGRFELKALPPGQRYTVTVSAKGYGQNKHTVEASESEARRVELKPLPLVLADRRLAGVVLDSDDKPVANASLYCYEDKQPSLNGRTDAKGRFSFDHVCPGPIRLSVNGPRGGAYANVTAEGGDTNVVVHLTSSSGSGREAARLARLQGKPLPDLAPLGVAAAECPKDQPLLVVLVDAEQRPSRRLLRLLTEQAAALKQKGVAVVVLQAGGMTAEAFAAWKQEAALPFPAASLKGEPEKARAAWGAGALPWLVLTDKEHRVTAEGFGLEELAAKLGAAGK